MSAPTEEQAASGGTLHTALQQLLNRETTVVIVQASEPAAASDPQLHRALQQLLNRGVDTPLVEHGDTISSPQDGCGGVNDRLLVASVENHLVVTDEIVHMAACADISLEDLDSSSSSGDVEQRLDKKRTDQHQQQKEIENAPKRVRNLKRKSTYQTRKVSDDERANYQSLLCIDLENQLLLSECHT